MAGACAVLPSWPVDQCKDCPLSRDADQLWLLALSALEIFHEASQFLNCLQRQSVVDRSPHPAQGAMARQAGKSRGQRCEEPLQAWLPQKRALYLISTGNRHALAAWGGFSTSGAWAWRWKDRIDRRFMAQFAS